MINRFKNRKHFIERSITSALSFLKEMVFCEEYAARKGLLQFLDPRVKTLTFLLFLFMIVATKNVALIGMLYGLCLFLAVCSGVPVLFFLVRTWVFIPLFALCIAIPSAFSWVTPGEPVAGFKLWGISFTMTRPGLDGAVLFVCRVTTSVSWVVLLSLTTRHAALLKVVRTLGVPPIFVLTLSMCYRYLHLLAVVVESIFTSLKSRVGLFVMPPKGRQVVSWSIANTWGRTTQMSEEVYQAMLSKGYRGEPQILDQFSLRAPDWGWLLACSGIYGALFFAGVFQ